jgi:MYXO-CTERM domain-containing protein
MRWLAPFVVVAMAAPAWAEEVPVDFIFDNDTIGKPLNIGGKPMPAGSILATRLRPEHALALDQVEFVLYGAPAAVEVHVWRDNGGNQPGAPGGYYTDKPGADWIPPRVVEVEKDGAWQVVDLSDAKLKLAPLELVWVGIKVLDAKANVGIDAFDQNKTELTAMLQTPDAPCNDGCGVPGNLLIRASGRYLDPQKDTWFHDVTQASGLAGGGRMAVADYDNDGDDDVLYAGGQLFRNDGKGQFTDVSKAAGLEGLNGSGALWGDFDNDGKLDIWFFGMVEHLAHNKGDGTFEEVGKGQFADSEQYPTEGAVLADFDHDGLLDIYNANYEWWHKDENGKDVLADCGPDFLWHNEGGLKFKDISQAAGIRKTGPWCGRGPTAADWDQDGDIDLFVNNYRLHPDFFFRNEAVAPLVFKDVAKTKDLTKGSGKSGSYGHGTGAQWIDADDDGDLDLFAANLAHPRYIAFSDRSHFFRNEGADGAWALKDLREATGVGFLETHSTPAFGDFDNDGDLDLAIGAYYGDRMGHFWRNEGLQEGAEWLQFSNATYPTGWVTWGCASIAWADLDGDGDLDSLANNQLFRNDYPTAGHWLKVRLRGTAKVNAAAIGAWVTVETGDGKVHTRTVSGGQGLATQDSLTMHFGLGTATQVQKLVVHWPGLPAETYGPLPAVDGVVELAEGKGITAQPKPKPAGADASGSGDGQGASGDGGSAATGAAAAGSGGCRAGARDASTGWWAALAAIVALVLGRRRRLA